MSKLHPTSSSLQDLLGGSEDAVTFGDEHPNGSGPSQPVSEDDLYDPKRFRREQSYRDIEVPDLVLNVPVRRPKAQTFIRVHPDPEFRFHLPLLHVEEDREFYLVEPDLVRHITGAYFYQLFTVIDRKGNLSLWPIRLPGDDGKSNSWWDSATDIALLAMRQWLQISTNQDQGGYDHISPEGDLSDPDWPNHSPKLLVRAAFSKRHIKSLDDFVLKRLRGAI